MIVSEQDALSRLGSPLNLINRLNNAGTNRRNSMGLFGINNNNKGIDSRPIADSNHKQAESEPDKQTVTEARTTFNNPFKRNNLTSSLTIPDRSNLPNHPSNLPSSNKVQEPEIVEPGLDDLVNNADSQVKLGLAHDEALDTLVNSVKLMKMKLDDIKPDKLPSVISATSKVVDQIQRQRIDAQKSRGNREVHFHFYTPTQKKIEDYNVVEVG